MNFDFLTPEIFDMLVITNLIVALILIAFRFYQDMTQKQVDIHLQSQDEAQASLAETDVSIHETFEADTNRQ